MFNNIVWKEGLFIRPQHFQQNNFYFMEELRRRTTLLGANRWGLFNIEVDNGSLSIGKVIIKHISGIMPDGTLFDIKECDQLLAIDLTDGDVGKYLYLSLPLSIWGSDEVYFEHEDKKPTRYRAISKVNVPNLNSGEESKSDILFSEYNFKILKDEDIPSGYTSIKLLRIKDITLDGHITLDNIYSPTFLHLHQAKKIVTGLQDIITVLQYRSDSIAEKLRGNTLETTELGDYLMLQLLNKAYIRLHYYTTQSQLHPADLYLEINSIIGELAVFMKKEKRIVTPLSYKHKRQNECFIELYDEIKSLLSMVLEKKSIALDMEKGKFGLYRTTIVDRTMFSEFSFILSVSAKYLDVDELNKLLLNNFKVSTVENIRQLVNLNLAGYKILPLASAPRQIPYRVDNSYFKIVLTPNHINELSQSAGFAFYLPENLQKGLRFTLWAIRDE